MKINPVQIPDSGLEIAQQYSSADLDLEREDIKFKQPINVSGRIAKGVNSLQISLKMEALIFLECSRCLEEFSLPLSKEFRLDLVIENDQEIDISNNLREEIILSYPLKPLCRSNCDGLCPGCGKNLNKEKCECFSNGRNHSK